MIDTMIKMIPILVLLLLEYYCLKTILQKLQDKIYFAYFDRTTWIVIVCVFTVFGLILYMWLEEN